jgi:predicted DNA-binding transcriptional regulator AlpA
VCNFLLLSGFGLTVGNDLLPCQDAKAIALEATLRCTVCRMTKHAGPLSSDWWTTKEVAQFLGIEEVTVRAYVTRHKMPQPDAYVGATKLWRQETIKQWAARRPRKRRPEASA